MSATYEIRELIRRSRSEREGERAGYYLTLAETRLRAIEAKRSRRDDANTKNLRAELQRASDSLMQR